MQSKRSWNDADDRARLPGHDEEFANHIPVRAEPSLPQPFRDQDRRVRAAPVFFGSEIAPQDRCYSENWEKAADTRRACTFSGWPTPVMLPSVQRNAAIASKVIVALPIEKVGVRNRAFGKVLCLLEHGDDAAGIVEWQRIQQYCVHDREDRRIGADPQSQRDYRDSGESWALVQLAQRVTNVLCEAGHLRFVLLGKLIPWANTRQNGSRPLQSCVQCSYQYSAEPKPLIVQRQENTALVPRCPSRTVMSGGEQAAMGQSGLGDR